MFYIAEGPPSDRQAIRAYYPVLADMAIIDDVICLGERVVIPASLRQTYLNALHAAHQILPPPGTSALLATATPPHKQQYHQQCQNSQSIPSSTFVLISSITKVQHTWCWSIATLAGPSSLQPPTAPRDWPTP